MDLFRNKASLTGTAGGMLTWTDIHRREVGGGVGGDDNIIFKGEFGKGPIPWGRRRDEFLGGFRPLSSLERSLFPDLRNHVSSPSSATSGEEQTSKAAQMTIFYGGNVNVYNNISNDKAHAIMVLASQHSSPSSEPSSVQYHEPRKLDFSVVVRRRELDFTPKTSIPMSLLEEDSITKDVSIPMARQQSIKRFLEKRRDRVSKQFPYGKS